MLVVFFLTYLIGALAAPFLRVEMGLVYFVAFLGVIVFLYGKFLMKDLGRRGGVLAAALVLISLSLALFRVDQSLSPKNDFLKQYVGQKVTLCGIVIDEPKAKDKETSIVVSVRSCDKKSVAYTQKVLVHAGPFSTFSYGDFIKTAGSLSVPKTSEDFDYKSFLAKDNIFYELRFASTTVVRSREGNIVLSWLYRLKQTSIQTLGKILPEPHSSLIAGLLIGAKASLGETWLDIFRRVGIVHIIVLSGYNITIVAKTVLAMLRRRSRKFRFASAVISIILFALFAGGGATIWRSATMALIALLATESYRKFHAGRALLLAGFVMTLFQPLLPAYDPSFQLSFLATIGLVYITPMLERYFSRVTDKFGLREIVTATFATQIAVLPVILTMSGTLSIIGPITNILILPMVPITMAFGFVTLVTGGISWVLALPFTFISYGLLSYILGVSSFLAKIPFSSVQIPLSSSMEIILYTALAFIVIRFHMNRNKLEQLGENPVISKQVSPVTTSRRDSSIPKAEEFEII